LSKNYSLKGKVPYEVARAIAEELVTALPETQIVGSLRRGCPIVGDVDLLTSSTIAMGLLPMLVAEVLVQGRAKVSARRGDIQVDLNFTPAEALGSALVSSRVISSWRLRPRTRFSGSWLWSGLLIQ